MKKNKLMILLIFACFLLLPFKVFAESNSCESVNIELENIELGGKGQNTTHAIGGLHFVTPTINIAWYESSNGRDYTLMDKNSTFDYNIYYKAVLDTSYDELNNGFDEGWEACGLSLDIIDEEEGKIDSKSYNGSSNIEYVFEPFWKYTVYLDLENLEYNGPTEIVEGEDLFAQLVPKKNYRLPTIEEARDMFMVRIVTNGNMSSNYYKNYGTIEIPSSDIKGYIEIYATAVEKNKIEFENKNYTYKKNSKNSSIDFIVPFEDCDTLYINNKEITNNSNHYYFDKTEGALYLYDELLDTFDIGTYNLRIEGYNNYGETTFKVEELDKVEQITINFKNITNSILVTEDQKSAFEFLIEKGLIIPNLSLKAICDKNQKPLFYFDDENNIILAEGVNENDNIIYSLTEEDTELYGREFAETQVPKTIEFIFGDQYKITLDANGGKFKDSDKYIIDDIINFDYTNFNKPTRDGYQFIGFFTEKKGGKSFEEVMNSEAGIEEDTIFYARWEKNSGGGVPEPEEENPKTFDGIGTSIFMGIISLIGLSGATIYLRRKNKVRAN